MDVSKIIEEEPEIDSLTKISIAYFQNISNQRRDGSNNVIIGGNQPTDPLTVFNRELSLHNEKLNIEKALFLKSDFEMVDGFTPAYTPETLNVKQSVIYSAGIGIAISYLIIFFIGINRWLSKVEKEKYSSSGN